MSADAEQEDNLNYMNQIGEASKMLDISIRITNSLEELTSNYA